MKPELNIIYNLEPSWALVNLIRDKIKVVLVETGKPHEFIDAILMTASELIENAIKYRDASTLRESIKFALMLKNGKIQITVINTFDNRENYNSLVSHIDSINSTNDPSELFMKRLMKIVNSKKKIGCQLGLFRIAYEGQFSLKYDVTGSVVKITAERDA